MFSDRPVITLDAVGAMEANRLVKLNASDPNKVEYCDELEKPYGVTTRPVFEAGKGVPVAPLKTSVMAEIKTAGALTLGASIYPADDGKIQVLSATVGDHYCIGKTREAVAADNAGDLATVQILEMTTTTVSGE